MAPTEELSKEPMEKAKQRLLHTVVKGKKKNHHFQDQVLSAFRGGGAKTGYIEGLGKSCLRLVF